MFILIDDFEIVTISNSVAIPEIAIVIPIQSKFLKAIGTIHLNSFHYFMID